MAKPKLLFALMFLAIASMAAAGPTIVGTWKLKPSKTMKMSGTVTFTAAKTGKMTTMSGTMVDEEHFKYTLLGNVLTLNPTKAVFNGKVQKTDPRKPIQLKLTWKNANDFLAQEMKNGKPSGPKEELLRMK